MAELTLAALHDTHKWRVFSGYEDMTTGTALRTGETLVWTVSPGEWTVIGERPGDPTVDLTHVRAMWRLTGTGAADLINRVCSLDLSDDMFPSGAAARTLFAGVATELVRDDVDDKPSYLLLPSSSFAAYVDRVFADAGREFDLVSE